MTGFRLSSATVAALAIAVVSTYIATLHVRYGLPAAMMTFDFLERGQIGIEKAAVHFVWLTLAIMQFATTVLLWERTYRHFRPAIGKAVSMPWIAVAALALGLLSLLSSGVVTFPLGAPSVVHQGGAEF